MKEAQNSVIQILDDVFRFFDFLCKQKGIQKIETVGKTYMACGGLKFIEEKLTDGQKSDSPIKRLVEVAIEMMNFIDTFSYGKGNKLNLKIGIHYGNCIFGVLGYHKPQFSLIGDTVNTTSRCCTTGPNGKIILSEEAHGALVKNGEVDSFGFYTRMAKMKGKGLKKTLIVKREPINDEDKGVSINPKLFMKNDDLMKKMQSSKKSSSVNEFSVKNLDAVNRILDDEENLDNSLELEIDRFQSEDEDEDQVFYEDYDSILEEKSSENDEKNDEEEGEVGMMARQGSKRFIKRKKVRRGSVNNFLRRE